MHGIASTSTTSGLIPGSAAKLVDRRKTPFILTSPRSRFCSLPIDFFHSLKKPFLAALSVAVDPELPIAPLCISIEVARLFVKVSFGSKTCHKILRIVGLGVIFGELFPPQFSMPAFHLACVRTSLYHASLLLKYLCLVVYLSFLPSSSTIVAMFFFLGSSPTLLPRSFWL